MSPGPRRCRRGRPRSPRLAAAARRWVGAGVLVGLVLSPANPAAGAPQGPVQTPPPAASFHLFAPRPAELAAAGAEAGSRPAGVVRLFGDDLRAVATSPGRLRTRGWLTTGLVALTLGALIQGENPDRDGEIRDGGETAARLAPAVERFGAEGSLGVLGAFYLAGKLADDPRAHDVAVDGAIASVLASGLITPILKEAFGRRRPRNSATGAEFTPFSGAASFPSGHTTQAFAVASVIAGEYGSRWVDAAAYGTAALVGLARVERDAHYLSDVVAGALIGTLVGRTVVRVNRARRGARVEVAPLVGGEGSVGVAVRVRSPR